jgi:hypothetical protein
MRIREGVVAVLFVLVTVTGEDILTRLVEAWDSGREARGAVSDFFRGVVTVTLFSCRGWQRDIGKLTSCIN